jgi:hypothetical protein
MAIKDLNSSNKQQSGCHSRMISVDIGPTHYCNVLFTDAILPVVQNTSPKISSITSSNLLSSTA